MHISLHTTSTCILRLLSAITVSLLVSQVGAQTTIWNGGEGDWQTSANWSQGVPTSIVNAQISNDGIVQLFSDATSRDLVLGSSNKSGSIELSTASASTVLTTTGDAHIGHGGGYGDVTITNAGTSWNVSRQLNVGATASGSLAVLSGAKVRSGDGTIALNATASGAATLAGNNSSWEMDGPFFAGYFGVGLADISDGARLSNTHGIVGSRPGSSGSVTVSGIGSLWSNSASLVIGDHGRGNLSVAAGGSTTASRIVIANEGDSSGEVILSGSSSRLTAGADIQVGAKGVGSLSVMQGAEISTAGATIGVFVGSQGTAQLSGESTTWIDTGEAFTVGSISRGSLSIQEGASLTSSRGVIGEHPNAEGLLTLDGSGSSWESSGTLVVGLLGNATAAITNGAAARSVAGTIGAGSGSSGALSIHNSGSSWSISNLLTVGNFGNGELYLGGGGYLESSSGTLGAQRGSSGEVTIAGNDSVWRIDPTESSLAIGYRGSGLIRIESGGRLESPFSVIGLEAGSSGEVVIDGADSSWVSNDLLYVGSAGSGVLTLRNGARIDVYDEIGVAVGLNGVLNATGTISAPTLVNQGRVNVGDNIGNLTVNGNYAHANTGALEFNIQSADHYDRMIVSNQVQFAGGSLTIYLDEAFVPSAGQVFDLMDWGSRIGSMEVVNAPILPNNLSWDISRFLSDGVISIVSLLPLSGDYDQDGDVDHADYVVWQSTYGSLTDHRADGNGDGIVNSADYTVWRDNFALTSGATAMVTAVAEPGAFSLVFVVCVALLPSRERVKNNDP